MVSGSSIHERARGNWSDILGQLGIAQDALSGKHCACPGCGGRDRFRYKGDGDGGFFCGDMRGNGVDLVMHVFDCDFRAACEKIETIIGKAPQGERWEAKPVSYAQRLRQRAMTTPRSAYLASRGLEIAPGLRWCDAVEYWDEGESLGTFPAMLGPVTDRDGKFRTYHVTYLDKGAKARVHAPRKILPGASIAGCGVALYAPAEVIGVAEGIETAIAAKMIHGMPVHAALNTSLLAKWDPPPIARVIHIFADRDENYAGEAAAYALAHRLAMKGLQVRVELPATFGDWNDVLMPTLAQNGKPR